MPLTHSLPTTYPQPLPRPVPNQPRRKPDRGPAHPDWPQTAGPRSTVFHVPPTDAGRSLRNLPALPADRRRVLAGPRVPLFSLHITTASSAASTPQPCTTRGARACVSGAQARAPFTPQRTY